MTSPATPSPSGAAPRAVDINLPEEWVSSSSPGSVWVSREPEPGPAGFWANIVLAVDPVGDDMPLDAILDALLASSEADTTELRLAGERIVEIAGERGVAREQVIRIEATELPLVQFLVVFRIDRPEEGRTGTATADCVQLTGTVEYDRRDDFAQLFEAVVSTIEFSG